MSSEQRTVRPFVGLDDFETSVAGFRLHVGDDVIEPGDRVVLSRESYSLRRIALELAPDDGEFDSLKSRLVSAAAAIDLDPSVLDLIVVGASSYLKISEVLLRESLADLVLLDRLVEISVTPRPRSLSTPHSGSKLDVYVCLNQNVDKVPLRPWRRGSWLAHADFRIETELASAGFTPRALTPEVAEKELGVPAGTTRFIRMAEGASPLDGDSSEDQVEMWVNASLLGQMAANNSTKSARLLQAQLALDAVAAILKAAHETDELQSSTFADIEDSLFGRVIELVAQKRGTRAERLVRCKSMFSLAQDPEQTTKFLAYAEDAIGLTKAATSAVED